MNSIRSFFVLVLICFPLFLFSGKDNRYLMKLRAKDSFERSLIANTGVSIESIEEDFVYVIAVLEERNLIHDKFEVVEEWLITLDSLDFPSKDSDYHNYTEAEEALDNLIQEFPDEINKFSIGKSVEGKEIWTIKITENIKSLNSQKPAILFLGGHHAREHLSVEVTLRLAQWIMREYSQGNSRIQNILATREIIFIPMVNPDGLEYDISDGRYKMWRKNRALNKNGTYGVDLNRNYGFKWGTGGSSSNPNSETYMGPQPFSEPETQAIKNFLTTNPHITILLSFHTFSELILYPWGHTRDPIKKEKDQKLYEVLAQTMSQWNKYKPMSSAGLYIASGDLTDWSYGELGIISFTFELDPKQQGFGGGGFYPGTALIETALKKNIEPALYLIELADNPYRALEN